MSSVEDKRADAVVHEREALEAYLDEMFAREGLTFETWFAMFGGGFYASRNQVILELVEPLRPRRVFEFACAGGFLARLLLERLPGIESYTCSNFSLRMVDRVRRQLEGVPRCDVRVVDVDVTRSADVETSNLASYDLFVTTSFEHIQFDRELIERFPEGAHFVFSVTGFDDPEHFRIFPDTNAIRERYGDSLELLEIRANPETNKFISLSRKRARRVA